MSLDKIHNELIDYVNVIYMANHPNAHEIKNFTLSITGTARPFLNSFMKIYNYTNQDYTSILIEITRFAKSNSYAITDKDYFNAIKLGLIPNGKEELVSNVELITE